MIKLTPKQGRIIALHKRIRDRSLAAAATPSIRADIAKIYRRTIGKASADCADCERGAPVGYYRCAECREAYIVKF